MLDADHRFFGFVMLLGFFRVHNRVQICVDGTAAQLFDETVSSAAENYQLPRLSAV